MKFEIKHRWSGEVIFSLETESMKLCLQAAIKSKTDLSDADLIDADLSDADLRGADLSDADLRGADLRGADLSDADLRGAVLSGADLRGADLSDAVLRGADLRGADLRGADLRGAVLRDADLRGAVLSGADLSDADLRGAVLRDADLSPIRDDYWLVLLRAPAEIAALREALVNGKVNGSAYEGECVCLVGTIANAKKCHYDAIPNLIPNASRPIERFFTGIKRGDTPKNNPCSKLAVEWIDQFVELQRASAELFLVKK